MFLLAGDFLEAVCAWRTCWIGGRLGGGKTLLAVAIADWLLENKMVDGVWANFPTTLPANSTLWKNAFLLDESWQFLDSRVSHNTYTLYGAWARKQASFWLFPSIFPPDNRVRMVSVTRVWQLLITPTPIWCYRWTAYGGDGGHFLLLPAKHFAQFESGWIPINDAGIQRAVMQFVLAEQIDTVHTRGLLNADKRRRAGTNSGEPDPYAEFWPETELSTGDESGRDGPKRLCAAREGASTTPGHIADNAAAGPGRGGIPVPKLDGKPRKSRTTSKRKRADSDQYPGPADTAADATAAPYANLSMGADAGPMPGHE